MGALIGRHAELSTALTHAKAALQGDARPLLVQGDPGVGKTRLCEELCEAAELFGYRVLRGRALEFETSLAYGPLADALNGAPADMSLTTEERQRLGPLLAPGSAEAAVQPGETDTLQSRTLLALVEVLQRWAASHPTIVFLDDLHWADKATLDMVFSLARRLRATSCLLVFAFRSTPPEFTLDFARFVAALEREATATRLTLEALDVDDTRALTAHLLGTAPSDRLALFVFDQARGNPFFVSETVQALLDSGAAEFGSEVAELSGDARLLLPGGGSMQVFHRIHALGADAVEVARALAVVGRVNLRDPAQRRALHAGAGLPEDRLDSGLDSLAKAGITTVEGDSTVAFSHSIVRRLVYDDIGAAERRSLHRAVAREFERERAQGLPVSDADLALHVAESADAGDEEAVALITRVGDSFRHTVPDVAATWYLRALTLLPTGSGDAEGRVLAKLGAALFNAERPREAAKAARRSLELLAPGRDRVRAAAVLASALTRLGRPEDVISEIDQLLPEADPQMRDRLLAHKVTALHGARRITEARELGESIVVEPATEAATRALVLRSLSGVAHAAGDFKAAAEWARQAAAISEEVGGALHVSVLASNASFLCLIGELDDGERALADGERLADDLAITPWREALDTARAYACWYRGDWDQAVSAAARVEQEAAALGLPHAFGTIDAPLLPVHVARGEFAAAREAFAVLRREGGVRFHNWLAAAEAELQMLLGDPGAATTSLEETWTDAEREGMNGVGVILLPLLVEAYWQLGAEGEARGAAERLAKIAASAGTIAAAAASDRAVGLVTGDEKRLRRAEQSYSAVGMPFELARTQLLRAEVGDPSSLRAAFDCFVRLGAEPWRVRAVSAMRAAGIPVPRRQSSRRDDGLTEVEARMAALVADGLSNKEISAALHVSTKTVEGYLSRIYAKTGCRNRSELAVAVVAGKLSGDPKA